MKKNKYLYLSFLFLIACSAPQAPYTAREPASAVQRQLAGLSSRALKKLQDSGLLHSEDDFDAKIWLENVHKQATTFLKEEYVLKLNAFLTELISDTATQQNIIRVKNLFLDPNQADTCPDLELTQHWYVSLLEKMAERPENLDLLLKIREGLYGSDGQRLRKILQTAAHNPDEKTILLEGILFKKCEKKLGKFACREKLSWKLSQEFFWHHSPVYTTPSDRITFSESKLMKNLDALAVIMGENNELGKDELTWTAIELIKIIDYRSLEWLHQYIQNLKPETLKKRLLWIASFLKESKNDQLKQLLSNLEPELREFGQILLKSYECPSLINLDQKGLQMLLEKTSALLVDHEHGAVRYIRDYVNP